MEEALNADPHTQMQLQKALDIENMVDLFELLDEDGSGEVSIDEFCDGIVNLAASDQPIEYVQIRNELRKAHTRSEVLKGDIDLVKDDIAGIAEKYNQQFAALEKILTDEQGSRFRILDLSLRRLEERLQGKTKLD